jgi:hypothetical protein
MAHYALLDSRNVVVQVITGVDEDVTQLDNGVEVGGSTEAWETFYSNQTWHEAYTCKRTSYNAQINGYRGKFAGAGDIYDPVNDIFVEQLNEQTDEP